MSGNQINLFKIGVNDNTHNGSMGWGSYAELLQGWYGDSLTLRLTDYRYNNYYLEEVKSLVEY